MVVANAVTVRKEQVMAAQVTAADIAKTEKRKRVARTAVDIARRKPEICSCSKYHIIKIRIIII